MVTQCGEWRLQQILESLSDRFNIPVIIRPDKRFFCNHQTFKKWAENRKELRMEYFYREQRRAHDILMQDGKPVGGAWNYDSQNRKKLPKNHPEIIDPLTFEPDPITKDVLALVASEFSDHFGDLEPFELAVTSDQAEQALDYFIQNALRHFGDYQDAMVTDTPFLYHSLLSFYINAGLLNPYNVCKKVEQAYYEQDLPLNAVEGFIRQILGWREYIRGIYWHLMPEYAERNALNANRPLPKFYWDAKTDMHCLHQAIKQTKQHAYAHHIQRLMITGNFALLAGLSVEEVCEWYLIVYGDAYEWVELPNTLGMALYGDGGVLGSKPYAASANYIHKMSNYCGNCRYDYKKRTGENACPFNYLYWDFLMQHEEKFRPNQRMKFMYSSLDRMADTEKDAIHHEAKTFLDGLGVVEIRGKR